MSAPEVKICERCNGFGRYEEHGKSRKCPVCNGTGLTQKNPQFPRRY